MRWQNFKTRDHCHSVILTGSLQSSDQVNFIIIIKTEMVIITNGARLTAAFTLGPVHVFCDKQHSLQIESNLKRAGF